MLYANTAVPLYRQLYRNFRKAIDNGTLAVGERLPSERQIAAEHGISRITARKAMAILRQEGYVCSFQGKGAFVSQSVSHTFAHTAVRGFSEIILNMGMTPSSRMLSCDVVSVTGEIADHLHVRNHDQAIKIRRLRLANGIPMALESAYLSYPLCAPILHVNLEKSSLYRILQEIVGIALDHADQSLRTVLTADGDIRLLRLEPPSPVVHLKRRTYDVSGRIIEYVESIYQGEIDQLKVFAGFNGG
jgi:GntR family transcriptional regulator